jgi:3-oxoacyl-[acyl-carrier protein] reductase
MRVGEECRNRIIHERSRLSRRGGAGIVRPVKPDAKVCIVTGGGTGTGAACALQLAHRGWRVVVNYSRSEAEALATATACERAGGEALVFKASVAEDEQCRAMAAAAVERWGRIDALVNSAGITKFAHAARLDALDAGDFQRIYAVNVIGAFQMIRACVPAMKQQGAGAVVNVSSSAGVLGIGSSVAYVASKGALNAMTLSLARALAPAIRVNAVCPGLIETRWHTARFDETEYAKFKQAYEDSVPLATAASADDVADAVLWFIEGARVVTGELLLVDSGKHLGKH